MVFVTILCTCMFMFKYLSPRASFLSCGLPFHEMDKITPEKLAKYFDVTGRALKKVKIAEKKDIDWKANAEDFLDMAQRYFQDDA